MKYKLVELGKEDSFYGVPGIVGLVGESDQEQDRNNGYAPAKLKCDGFEFEFIEAKLERVPDDTKVSNAFEGFQASLTGRLLYSLLAATCGRFGKTANELTEEIKPCPFCKGDAVYVDENGEYSESVTKFVSCNNSSCMPRGTKYPVAVWQDRG